MFYSMKEGMLVKTHWANDQNNGLNKPLTFPSIGDTWKNVLAQPFSMVFIVHE